MYSLRRRTVPTTGDVNGGLKVKKNGRPVTL